MNKKTLVAVAIVTVAALAAGGVTYFLASQKDTANSDASSAQQREVNAESNKLVKTVLDKVKTSTSTVMATRVITKDTDPENSLGKTGQYQYAGSFYDSRTGYSPVGDDYSTAAGGAIEIYATEKDATARGEYLAQLQTGANQAGAYKVAGKSVLRVSRDYTANQQIEMLTLMNSAL
jgi:hypothetical protein